MSGTMIVTRSSQQPMCSVKTLLLAMPELQTVYVPKEIVEGEYFQRKVLGKTMVKR